MPNTPRSIKLLLIVLFLILSSKNSSGANDIKSYVEQAHSLYNEKKYDSAETLCRKALEMDPSYTPPYNLLGSIYAATDRPRMAIQYLEKSLSINPGQSGIYLKVAYLYSKLDGIDKMIEYLEKNIKRAPDSKDLYNYLGFVYLMRKQDPVKAVEYFSRAYDGRYDKKLFYFTGAAYLLNGDPVKALDFVLKLKKGGDVYLAAVLEDYIKKFSLGQSISVSDIFRFYDENYAKVKSAK